MALSEPVSLPSDWMDYVTDSARAWEGDYNWSDPDNWDPAAWDKRGEKYLRWPEGSAKLILADGYLRIASVDSASARKHMQGGGGRTGRNIDAKSLYGTHAKAVGKHWHTLIAWSEDESAEANALLGIPGIEGILILQTVFAQDDQLVPVSADWIGRRIDAMEGTSRLRTVLDVVNAMEVRPKKPAPEIPPDLTALIERGRGDDLTRMEQHELVDQLLATDRITFLEALDRMLPWMKKEGSLEWLSQRSEVADRLWRIKQEVPSLEGQMRLTPWKSGVGNPLNLDLPLGMKGSYNPPKLERKPDGTF